MGPSRMPRARGRIFSRGRSCRGNAPTTCGHSLRPSSPHVPLCVARVMPKASHLSAFEATYEKGPILGRGASGVAFVVRPKGGPEAQQVAKEICVGRFDEKRRKDAFEESKLLRALNHDNIVKCMDTFLDDEVLYIV